MCDCDSCIERNRNRSFHSFRFSRFEELSFSLNSKFARIASVIASIAVALYSIRSCGFSDSKNVRERTKVYDVKEKKFQTKMYKCHGVRARLYGMSVSLHRKKRVSIEKNEQRYNCRLLGEKFEKKREKKGGERRRIT